MKSLLSHDEPLAKPSGITLAKHTADVVSEAAYICKMLPSSVAKYDKFVQKSLPGRLKVVAEFHDVGKKNPQWQNACVKDWQAYVHWCQRHAIWDFNQYARSVGKRAGQNLQKSGVRHELFSLKEAAKSRMPKPLLAAIASHHGKLSYNAFDRWGAFLEYRKAFEKLSNHVIEQYCHEELCQCVFEYNGLRGLLQMSDHRASAKEEGMFTAEINRFSYSFPFEQKRGIQKLVETEWEKNYCWCEPQQVQARLMLHYYGHPSRFPLEKPTVWL